MKSLWDALFGRTVPPPAADVRNGDVARQREASDFAKDEARAAISEVQSFLRTIEQSRRGPSDALRRARDMPRRGS